MCKEEEKNILLKPATMEQRLTLPAKRNPKQKISIWTILKDLIGKDFVRFSVPGTEQYSLFE